MSEFDRVAAELGLDTEPIWEEWTTDLRGRPLNLEEIRWVTLWQGFV